MTQPKRSGGSRPAWLADEEPAAARTSPARRIVGLVAAGLTIAVLLLFALGAWNPWHLVVLSRYFGNPLLGVVVGSGLALAAVWLLTPVVSEAAQGRRLWARFLLGAVLLVSLGAWGLFGSHFSGDYRVVAESADGSRRLVMHTRIDDRELRIWSGTGLTARDRGLLGLACGEVIGTFSGNDRIHVSSVYGEFDLTLDPATGAPTRTIGPTCSG